MGKIEIQLLGRFGVRISGNLVSYFEAVRAQELFAYLLLNPRHIHNREILAGTLWGDRPSAQARKYLRQALWQLQVALDTFYGAPNPVLRISHEHIALSGGDLLSVDATTLVRAHQASRDAQGAALAEPILAQLRQAVDTYQGDLLAEWEHEWCLYERERLRLIFLALLDRLVAHSLACGEYETGIEDCTRVLRYEPASERTHRQLMVLHHRSGDRTAALRQFQRCVIVLKEELGVEPARSTVKLYDDLCADRCYNSLQTIAGTPTHPPETTFNQLVRLKDLLEKLQDEVREELEITRLPTTPE